jgi:AraC-like DNA-binding protein
MVPARRQVLLLDCAALEPLTHLAAPFEAQAVDWTALAGIARTSAPSTVIVIDPFVSRGSPELDARIPALLAAAHMLPVVGVVPFRATYHSAVRTLLGWGLTDIADAELENTADAIRLRLLSIHAQPLKKLVEASLSRFVSADALTLIRAAAEVAVDRGTAIELGRLFGSSERTVSGWCAREGLPPPRRLLAWLRLLLALALLEGPGRSVLNAALCAGYTDHSLRRALRELLGEKAPTREWALSDGLAAFNGELRELRERARQKRRRTERLPHPETDAAGP